MCVGGVPIRTLTNICFRILAITYLHGRDFVLSNEDA